MYSVCMYGFLYLSDSQTVPRVFLFYTLCASLVRIGSEHAHVCEVRLCKDHMVSVR